MMAWNFRQFKVFYFLLLGTTKLLPVRRQKTLPFSCYTFNVSLVNPDSRHRKTCQHSGHFPPERMRFIKDNTLAKCLQKFSQVGAHQYRWQFKRCLEHPLVWLHCLKHHSNEAM